MRLTNLQFAKALPNTRGFGGKRLKMSNESSYIFMLRNEDDSLEVKYNQQIEGVSAQVFITRGCFFNINNLEDMDKLISYLSEIRQKMVKYYAAKRDRSLAEAIASGPYCTQCGNPQTKEEIGARIALCFDCEKKQIIQAADSFNPVVCMICEGKFDNSLQRQVGICGTCQKKAEAGPENKPLSEDGLCMALGCYNPRSPMGHYCETHTPYVGVDKQYLAKRPLICLVKSCDRPCVEDSGYCSTHKEDHDPIRRKIAPTDITKPGC